MLLFVVALLVAGGLIAYVGDRLGTYIGKKRLTAWGLRPRHTAMLWTVVSGGAIAVLTLFALIAYDRTVQRALLYGPQLLEENYRLRQENRVQRVQTARLALQVQQKTMQAQIASQETITDNARFNRARTHLRAARAELAQSQNDLRSRLAQLAQARQGLNTLNVRFTGAQSGLRAARSRVAQAEADYQQARAKFRAARGQYAIALDTVNQIERKGEELDRQNSALAVRNAALTAQNTALETKNQQLLTQAEFLQGAHLIYHKGQEVGRDVIPTNLSPVETRHRLDVFLDTLSRQTQELGAVSGANGLAVQVLAGADATPVSEDDAVNALSQSIAAEPDNATGVVVRAVAGANAFGGEPTPVVLQPYDNVLIYPKGALIAETDIDGTLPENQILNALSLFLKQRVQPDALNRGIIPRPDPQTGEPVVGEPTDDQQTYNLVKQIQRIGLHALVTARAATDTYTTGPLRLDLSAVPPPLSPAPPAPSALHPASAVPQPATAGSP